jgi:hypothetical protein
MGILAAGSEVWAGYPIWVSELGPPTMKVVQAGVLGGLGAEIAARVRGMTDVRGT